MLKFVCFCLYLSFFSCEFIICTVEKNLNSISTKYNSRGNVANCSLKMCVDSKKHSVKLPQST